MQNEEKDITEKDILSLLEVMGDDPASCDAFFNAWNYYFTHNSRSDNNAFTSLEVAARSSLSSMNDTTSNPTDSLRTDHLLEEFGSPAFIVKENGQVSAQNTIALETYSLSTDAGIDDLPFALERSEPITDVVRASHKSGQNSRDVILKRAYSVDDDSIATLAIAPLKQAGNSSVQALLFVIDARWKTRATGLIKKEFDLSKTEQELLVSFLDGQSIQTIAKTRHRSPTTIRTQFYSLMRKLGANTQTELLRSTLSVSQFVDQVEEIAEVIRHPHRKRVNLVRPGGRSVEVTMAGDFTGNPIIFLQSGITYTFESKIEQAFHDAGLCLLSICRPGYGDTDPAPKGEDSHKIFTEDLNSLLDQLGHAKCLVMSSNLSSAVMYALSPKISDRVKGLIQISAAAPACYHENLRTSVSWAQAIITAATQNPLLQKLMLNTSVRAWKVLGQAKFRKMAFKMDTGEYENATRPEALRDAQMALDTATKQGFDVITSDMLAIFSDFKQDVISTELPILAIHGSKDPVFKIEALRMFANDLSHRFTLVELNDAGFSAMATHIHQIVSHIVEFEQKLLEI